MKKLLETIIASILEENSDFQIQEEEIDGVTNYTINAPKEDLGRIIGREGRVINSIRILCRLKAQKLGQRIFIKVLES